jgi:hypothetical protein
MFSSYIITPHLTYYRMRSKKYYRGATNLEHLLHFVHRSTSWWLGYSAFILPRRCGFHSVIRLVKERQHWVSRRDPNGQKRRHLLDGQASREEKREATFFKESSPLGKARVKFVQISLPLFFLFSSFFRAAGGWKLLFHPNISVQ